jgi:Fe-S-cluster-containing hydrogenase component 2
MVTEMAGVFYYNLKKHGIPRQNKERGINEMSIFNLFKEDNNEASNKEKKDMTLSVKHSRCPQNHPCPSIRVCPSGALTQKGFNAPEVDKDTCTKCGKCVRFCPMGALMLK